jgi:hypothetical protein
MMILTVTGVANLAGIALEVTIDGLPAAEGLAAADVAVDITPQSVATKTATIKM